MTRPTTTTRVAGPRRPADPLSDAGRLAADMVARWAAGERPTAADYAARHPHLRTDPDAALELIAEELALREEHALPADPDALAAAFPGWAAQVRALVRCRAALGPDAGPPFPLPGDTLGEFRLVRELGRGAAGRVFLAAQPALADRPVVLKLAPAGGGEHLSLARLQHTHIVPLLSAHSFPDYGLEGLCLPYFGGRTLAAARLASADAAARLGAALADALGYAHARGLLHLDVKPSNVLVADDGTPMLLDFHLARPPLAAGEPAPPVLGGTPGYMPPEQAAAVEAVRWQARVPAAVDARADVFALGVVLRELLAAVPGPVPPGLADIAARAAAPAPAARYPSAAALAADLRRHLADEPLRGVRNRSLAERWRKWRRRRPVALPLVLVGLAAAALAVGLFLHAAGRAARADTALRDGTDHLAAGRPAEAAAAFRAGTDALAGLPFHANLRADLAAGRRRADRGRAAAALRAVCDRVRPLYGAGVIPVADVPVLRAACREVWAERDHWPDPTPAERDDLLDLALLLADLEARAGGAAARTAALAVLDDADRRFGPRAAVDLARGEHLRALGRPAAADAAARRAPPPRTAWDFLALARSALAAGDAAAARPHAERAVELDPGSVWGNATAGACRLRTGDAAGALAAFAACAALAPDRAWCLTNRGLAYLDLGRPAAALADFDRALALDPDLGAARLGRADAHTRAGHHAAARADLDRAEAAGAPAADVAARRARLGPPP